MVWPTPHGGLQKFNAHVIANGSQRAARIVICGSIGNHKDGVVGDDKSALILCFHDVP